MKTKLIRKLDPIEEYAIKVAEEMHKHGQLTYDEAVNQAAQFIFRRREKI